MTFTTPCFVRVEDAAEREKLIEWLRSVGHTVYPYYAYEGWHTLVCDPIAGFDLLDVAVTRDDDAILKERDLYDCGTNIELFKALAAMNDKNHLEQWFVDGSRMFKCYGGRLYKFAYLTGRIRKATVEEIVKHFNNK